MSNVTVHIPEEALTLAGLDDQSDSDRVRLLVALERLHEERVSLGRAAEFAGQSVMKRDARKMACRGRTVGGPGGGAGRGCQSHVDLGSVVGWLRTRAIGSNSDPIL